MRTRKQLNYWEDRFLSIEERRGEIEKAYLASMNERYDKVAKSIKSQIEQWVEKYANESGITKEAAETLLSKPEQKTWRMELKEFRQKAIDGGYDDQLNKEYYKSRITRLQRLERQLYFELAEVANLETAELEAYLMETLDDTYLQNIYELTDRGSFSITFERYSSVMLKEAVYKKWKGADFSQRIWRNHLKYLPEKLSRAMAEGIAKGYGTDKIVDLMMDGVDNNLRNRMITLVQTESAHIAEQASQKSYRETGVERYMWLATLEVHTCEQCGSLDSKIFVVGGKKSPQPIRDTHPNCRCTTVPYYEGLKLLTRWQRDPVTGKGKIKEFQPYGKWKSEVKAA